MREIGVHEGTLLCALYCSLKRITRRYTGMDIYAVFDEREERLRRTNCISTDELHIQIRFFPDLCIRETARDNGSKDIGILLNLFDECIHGFAILLFNSVLRLHWVLLLDVV